MLEQFLKFLAKNLEGRRYLDGRKFVVFPGPHRRRARYVGNRSKYMPHQGAQECERRHNNR